MQGGLEVPCVICCSGLKKDDDKVQRLIKLAPNVSEASLKQAAKKPKVDESLASAECIDEDSMIWLMFEGYSMTVSDKMCLLQTTDLLNDRHINFGQKLLRSQFEGTEGLINTLFQSKIPTNKITTGLQIIHDRNNHWIVASTINSDAGCIQIFDSVYKVLNEATKKTVANLFSLSDNAHFKVMKIQKQLGGYNCGVFALAIALSILLNINPEGIFYRQQDMRRHLLECFEKKEMTMFPTLH